MNNSSTKVCTGTRCTEKKHFVKPWQSVRKVMKYLNKTNLEFIYYARKLCFF